MQKRRCTGPVAVRNFRAAHLGRCDVAKKTVTKKRSASKKGAKTARKKTTAGKAAVAKPAKKMVKKVAPRRPKGPAWQWSAVETAAAIRSRAISAVETVE